MSSGIHCLETMHKPLEAEVKLEPVATEGVNMFAPEVVAENRKKCPIGSVPALLGLMSIHKPTYASLIAMAIHSSPEKRLMLNEIYEFVNAHRTMVPTASQPNWKNSIRHNLSLRPCFKKVPRWTSDGKKLSAYWVLDQSCLPSAALTMVQQLDAIGNVRFPDEFLCTDPALNPGDVELRSPLLHRTGHLTPDNSDDSGDHHYNGGSHSAKRRKKSKAQEGNFLGALGAGAGAGAGLMMQNPFLAAAAPHFPGQFPNPFASQLNQLMLTMGPGGMPLGVPNPMQYLQHMQQMAGMMEIVKQQAVAAAAAEAVAAASVAAATATAAVSNVPMSPPTTPIQGGSSIGGKAAKLEDEQILRVEDAVEAEAEVDGTTSPNNMTLLLAAAGVE